MFLADNAISALDRAADLLRTVAIEGAADDPARSPFGAASDRLASYGLAAKVSAEAGVSPERLAALVERGWRDAARAFTAAQRITGAGMF